MKILITGSTGMLGSMVLKHLTEKGLDITAPTRKELDSTNFEDYDYIINCAGKIRQKLNDRKEAILINSIFPYILRGAAPKAKIIQIATDCVYSGKKGKYVEEDEHDALDVYGKTKSLGEVGEKNFHNIRTSVIGPIGTSNVSLLEWFLSQKKNAKVNGYANHYWNGITTLHFAKLCYVIIDKNLKLPHLFHFVPDDSVTKYELLNILAKKYKRKDIKINKMKTPTAIDRTLKTNGKSFNKKLWKLMGYKNPPTIKEMIDEL